MLAQNKQNLSSLEVLAALRLAKDDLISFAIAMSARYQPSWHHEAIGDALQAIAQHRRIMFFLPPRHGKSQLASIYFPAWYIGNNPDKEIITASYGADLASDFGRAVRDIINEPKYKIIFPDINLSEDSQAKNRWHTTQGGSYIAAGVGGAITGRGADLLIIDDPIKNREEANSEVYRKKVWDWYRSTAYTRLQPHGSIILILTRWHTDDLAGRILADEEGGWHVVSFPAIATQDEYCDARLVRKQGEALWASRYSLEELDTIKRAIGPYEWSALYQQQCIDEETQEFKRPWLQVYEVLPKDLSWYTSVDPAISKKESADRSCVMTVAVDSAYNKYIVEYTVGRFNPSELIDVIFRHYSKYHADMTIIETNVYQQALAHFLQKKMETENDFFRIEEVKSTTDKEVKIRGLIPHYSNGKMFHRPNMSELELELAQFPLGKHDDIIDALALQKDFWVAPEVGKPEEPSNPYLNDPTSPWYRDKNKSKGYSGFYSY